LIFYRGGWCPFCNFQIRELTHAYGELRKRGVMPVAVSVDRTDEATRTSATYEIPFRVLSDPDLQAHEAFKVVHHADDAEVARLKGFGMDIEQYSGRDHHAIAIPSMFVIDKSGMVRWAHAARDYKTRPSPEQLFAALDGLALPPGPNL
jgi:peroxiredoxin